MKMRINETKITNLTPAPFRILQVCRLVETTRLFRSHMGISVIKTLRSSSIEVLAILGIIGIMSVFFGVLIYFAELTAPDNSSNLSNVGDGVWFALITITTVGYGEISPSTILGRIMASFCGIIGVLIIAMVVPVVSNLYQEFYDRQKDAKMFADDIIKENWFMAPNKIVEKEVKK
ncbi:hypothetical protein ACOME3_001622 [Neoechinorhynchus agilis]